MQEAITDHIEDIESLPVLEGFIRESARFSSSDSISVRRKVIQPFTFADGMKLIQDDVVCIPLQSILMDGKFYENPNTFDPHRLGVRHGAGKLPTFTDASYQFPLWGLGKHSW